MQTQLDLMEVKRKPARTRLQWLTAIAENQGHQITCAKGCCEPGYDDKTVVMADWNNRTRYYPETGKRIVVDNTMPRLAKLFGKLGYDCEWEDEWGVCEECGKALRTQPSSYQWTPYYVEELIEEGVFMGLDCHTLEKSV